MPIPTKNLLARNVFENECIKMRKAFCRNSRLCFKTKKWVSLPYRAATTNYLCCDQALEDSKGAGRMGLTRISKNVQLMTVSCATFLDCGCKGRRFF